VSAHAGVVKNIKSVVINNMWQDFKESIMFLAIVGVLLLSIYLVGRVLFWILVHLPTMDDTWA